MFRSVLLCAAIPVLSSDKAPPLAATLHGSSRLSTPLSSHHLHSSLDTSVDETGRREKEGKESRLP